MLSLKSNTLLTEAHRDVQTIISRASNYYKFEVIKCRELPDEVLERFKIGRKLRDEGDPKARKDWNIVELNSVLTNYDGYTNKSPTQMEPKSKGIFLTPTPDGKKPLNYQYYELAGVVMTISRQMKELGMVEFEIKTTPLDISFYELVVNL